MKVSAVVAVLLATGLVVCSSRSRVAAADPGAATSAVTPAAGEGLPGGVALPSPVPAPLPLCPAPGKGAASYT